MKFDPTKDYYAILGISHNANESQIHQAYKTLVSKYHPDKHQGNDLEELAKEKLVAINEAYSVLSKPELKTEYDAARTQPHRQQVGSSSAATGNGGTPNPPPPNAATAIRKFVFLIAFLAALPFILRFVRSPRAAAVIGFAVLLAWFGPRILKKIKK
ncbi:MAG: J domain-containing protein [Deltaproteobacteria bacterium]|nr:J domain-containing protein [Deltaproteobacteria bacterium]MBN2671737.1 J domain-containing protein [Deltaproteobacteria bacterium]